MNPFSLDHIFHRSLAYRNPRQVMTPITIPVPRLHLSGQLHHGLFTLRTPGAIQRTFAFRSPFPRVVKEHSHGIPWHFSTPYLARYPERFGVVCPHDFP